MEKINDVNFLLSYFKEKYEKWFLSRGKERSKIENIVFDFVDKNLDDSIYLEANEGSASGLCSSIHFKSDINKLINVLETMVKNANNGL